VAEHRLNNLHRGVFPDRQGGRSVPKILVAVSLARWGHATRAYLHNREPSIHL
jgi:hypothetical protein